MQEMQIKMTMRSSFHLSAWQICFNTHSASEPVSTLVHGWWKFKLVLLPCMEKEHTHTNIHKHGHAHVNVIAFSPLPQFTYMSTGNSARLWSRNHVMAAGVHK